ncbi:hypothetical protein TIFTF001_051274 [Ficus carica]|uniref:Uncharacterized protein n=1 Tax=Ficus carica TaxID=3494 RepID=A0AA87Z0V9_FICCA|nr:hypothetical protein TIFTF001_051274 [Ficus carica]
MDTHGWKAGELVANLGWNWGPGFMLTQITIQRKATHVGTSSNGHVAHSSYWQLTLGEATRGKKLTRNRRMILDVPMGNTLVLCDNNFMRLRRILIGSCGRRLWWRSRDEAV